jgi:hypothetical protein
VVKSMLVNHAETDAKFPRGRAPACPLRARSGSRPGYLTATQGQVTMPGRRPSKLGLPHRGMISVCRKPNI